MKLSWEVSLLPKALPNSIWVVPCTNAKHSCIRTKMTLFFASGPFSHFSPNFSLPRLYIQILTVFFRVLYSRSFDLFRLRTLCSSWNCANQCRLSHSFLHLVTILHFQPLFNLIHMCLLRCFQPPKIPWWYIWRRPSLLYILVDFISCQKTIDLRDNQRNIFEDAYEEDSDTQTIFEAERPGTFDCGAKQASNTSIKVCPPSQFSVLDFIFYFILAKYVATHS